MISCPQCYLPGCDDWVLTAAAATPKAESAKTTRRLDIIATVKDSA